MRFVMMLLFCLLLATCGPSAFAAGRGMIGATFSDVTPEDAEAIGLERLGGAKIHSVISGTPAKAAGLKSGDIIVAVNGQRVPDAGMLTVLVGMMPPGSTIMLKVYRAGRLNTVTVTVAEQRAKSYAQKSDAQQSSQPGTDKAWLGISFGNFTTDEALAHGWPDRGGVRVLTVAQGSPAAKAGLARDDIIVALDDQPLPRSQALSAVLAVRRPGARIHLRVFRRGRIKNVAVVLGVKPQAASTPVLAEKQRQPYVAPAQPERMPQAYAPPAMAGKFPTEARPDAQTPPTPYSAPPRAQAHSETKEEELKQKLAEAERIYGPNDRRLLNARMRLAVYYMEHGRAKEAQTMIGVVQSNAEHAFGKDNPQTQIAEGLSALSHMQQGRSGDAEAVLKASIARIERSPQKSINTMLLYSQLVELTLLYLSEQRLDDAAAVMERAQRTIGGNNPIGRMSMQILANIYNWQKRYTEAERIAQHLIAATEHSANEMETVLARLILARAYVGEGRYDDAEALLTRVANDFERINGKKNLSVLASKGYLYALQGRYAEAEALIAPSVEADGKVALVNDTAGFGYGLARYSTVHLAQGHWSKAAEILRQSTAILIRAAQRNQSATHSLPTIDARNTGGQIPILDEHAGVIPFATPFTLYIKAQHRLTPAGQTPSDSFKRESFAMAQWALRTDTSQTLSQMAARGFTGNEALAELVRERQDLSAQWQKRNKMSSDTLAMAPAQRDTASSEANMAQLAAIDTRLAEIDKRLAREFPDYAALASGAPLTVEDAQAALHDNEALVMFLDTPTMKFMPGETFVWVVTKNDIRWVRINLDTQTLTKDVQTLRCGLDAAAAMGNHCKTLSGQTYTGADAQAGKPLAFDHALANRLYEALFAQIKDDIKGKSLLIVPSGALTQLPFQVLETAPGETNNENATWLIRDHAVTILPAVSSLQALRRVSRPSRATKPLLGFGNPLLDGRDAYGAELANIAKATDRCDGPALLKVASATGFLRGVKPIDAHGGAVDPKLLRTQDPLPETALELCSVARDMDADLQSIHLGARATEREVKSLSAEGTMAQYRIVYFATHGALAGQLTPTAEPGLILTPPATATAEDDGYLSASEIAALKLDADWVVLSACNTAAGDATDAQALSGMARAFFYAQARALLVSHWAVNSKATVALITTAMHEMAQDDKLGRAEAMRRAMLDLIGKGDAWAHPAYWAPFVVVGEGAR